jgi:hypothetical protein
VALGFFGAFIELVPWLWAAHHLKRRYRSAQDFVLQRNITNDRGDGRAAAKRTLSITAIAVDRCSFAAKVTCHPTTEGFP